MMNPHPSQPIVPHVWIQEPGYTLYEKNGAKYAIVAKSLQHDARLWKFWQVAQALFYTIITAGIGLATVALQNKWNQAWTGKEKQYYVKRWPPAESTETAGKVQKVSAVYLLPFKENEAKKLDALVFLDRIATRPDLLSKSEIKKGFQNAYAIREELSDPNDQLKLLQAANACLTIQSDPKTLALGRELIEKSLSDVDHFKDQENKTSLVVLVEAIALKFIKANDFETALALRMQAAKALSISPPLSELSNRFAEEHSKLGFRIHPIDTSIFKNHVIAVQKRQFTDGSKKVHIETRIGHPARKQLQATLDWFKDHPNDVSKSFADIFGGEIRIEFQKNVYLGRKDEGGRQYEGKFSKDKKDGFSVSNTNFTIHIEGVGQVQIGSDSFLATEYNRISVDFDPTIKDEEIARKLTLIFAALGLGAVATTPRKEDEERHKIFQLFRVFFPRQAFSFERESRGFLEPLESLKARIVQEVPEMMHKFKYYFEEHPELIYPQEVYPGQPVWAIRGIAEEVKNAGGMGLMSAVTGSTFWESATRLPSILKIGVLSSQDRFQLGIIATGTSPEKDFASGGAEYVFARLLTKEMPKDPFAYPIPMGNLHLLYDLSILDRVGMAYLGDEYGTKVAHVYGNRPSILELIKKLAEWPHYLSNEVCIHHRIPPQFIKGAVVRTQEEKEQLIDILKIQSLVTINSNKEQCINGIPIDKFIHIGEFKEEYWA